MTRFHNFDARMRAAAPPPSNRIAAIMAAVKGGTAPKCAVAVTAKPSPTAPLASVPAPAVIKASAPAKPAYVAKKPLAPRLQAIRDEVLAEMAHEAKTRRQAAIRASWVRAAAHVNYTRGLADAPPRLSGENHGWDAIHAKIRAERASARKG